MVTFYSRKYCLALSLLTLTGFSVLAQSESISLASITNSVRNHMPAILQKKAILSAARAGIKDARHSFLPTAFIGDELNIGTDNSLPGSYLSFGTIPSTSSGLHASNNYQSAVGNIAIFQSQYELVDFGFKKARINAAKAYADLSESDLDREVYLLEWQTCKLYFDILNAQLQMGIDHQNVMRYEAIYKVIQALTLSGVKAGADSSLAMAELSKSRITYNQTEGQVNQLLQQMSYLTGLPVSKIAIDTTIARNYPLQTTAFGNSQAGDSAGNPIIDYYGRQKMLDLENENLVSKSFQPKLFLTATSWGRGSSIDYANNYKSLSQGLGYQRFNYLLGATFVYDLFNSVHRKDKIAISHNEFIASDYALQQEVLTLRNTENQANEAISTASKNLIEVPVQIKASEDTYNQKTAQYKAGIINLIDLTNASFVLYRSQLDYVQTLSDWFLAKLDKAAATGQLDSFIQSFK